jgi:ketosteroid isomerase-like protein
MKTPAISIAVLVLALAGCGGSGKDDTATHAEARKTGTATRPIATGTLPPGAVEPADPEEQSAEGPAATEASPGVSPVGPKASGELSGEDSSAVTAAVSDYIRSLDRHDARRVCSLFAPGTVDLSLLPKQRDGCVPSLRESIGTPPSGGAPAWRRTTLVEVKPEDLGDGRARVSATVTHHFSDRRYVSVEDDVVYLEKAGGRWLIVKPSATLYRAVGYESPPLGAFTPPTGW